MSNRRAPDMGEGESAPLARGVLPPMGGGFTAPAESSVRVGIVAGHSGPYPSTGYVDPGAVCDDGLTELEVNQNIANLVVRSLQAAGYNAELLQEWDPRLTGYRAGAPGWG